MIDAGCSIRPQFVIEYIADGSVVLREGQVEESGPADRVLEWPQHDYTRTLLAAVPRLAIPITA